MMDMNAIKTSGGRVDISPARNSPTASMKVAYICEPQVGGTFVFFTQLRPQLARHGIDFRCIPPFDRSAFRNSRYLQMDGIDFLDLPEDPPAALNRIIRHLEEQAFGAVLVLPGCNELGTALPAYLPAHIGCVAKIPHNGRGTYLPTREMEPFIDRIAPVNDLLAEDLSLRYGVPASKIQVIHIGIDPDHFQYAERTPLESPSHPLRLIFVGRINDLEKNTHLLPDMVGKVIQRGVNVTCTVLGDGEDRPELERRIHKLGLVDRFSLPGAVPYSEIPALLQQSDVFVMPSRFEGCPHALLEAMATGCVPVVSRLRGTLDRIVEEGQTGLMASVGRAGEFAEAIVQLAHDPNARHRMGLQARKTILDRFALAGMAEAYAAILTDAAHHPASSPPPRSLATYTPPRSMGPSWRRWIPMPVKKMVRTLYGRMGRSI